MGETRVPNEKVRGETDFADKQQKTGGVSFEQRPFSLFWCAFVASVAIQIGHSN